MTSGNWMRKENYEVLHTILEVATTSQHLKKNSCGIFSDTMTEQLSKILCYNSEVGTVI